MISDERLDHFAVHENEISWNWEPGAKEKLLETNKAISKWYDSNELQQEYQTCDDYLRSLGDKVKQVD